MITLHLLSVLPYVVLTLGGILLQKRWRSTASLLVALGFAVALLVHVARVFMYLTFQPPIEAHHPGDPFAFRLYYMAVPWWQRYVELLGMWAAAIGLLWHASRKP